MINKKKILIVFIALLLAVSTTYSQNRSNKFARGNARVHGVVLDEAGNPLEGALVVFTHEDRVTKFEKKSDKKGKWVHLSLGDGEFSIVVTLKGYTPYNTLMKVSQINRNPKVKVIMKKMAERVVQEDLKPKLEAAEKLYKEKKYDEAMKIYNHILVKAPKLYQLIFKIADCINGKGDIKKAVETYEKGIKMAVEKKDVASAAQAIGLIGGMYLKKNDLKSASVYFKRSVEMNPKDEILAYNVAEINFNNMKTDEAIKYYQMAINIKPTWGPPYKQIGYAYLNKGDMKKSVEMFKKFLEIDPNSKDAAIVKQVIQSLPK